MAFGLNKTTAFIFKMGERVGTAFAEFSLGFTEELILNGTKPAEAGAMDLIEAKTIKTISHDNLAKTASTAVVKTLSSSQVRGKIFSVIAGATTNLI